MVKYGNRFVIPSALLNPLHYLQGFQQVISSILPDKSPVLGAAPTLISGRIPRYTPPDFRGPRWVRSKSKQVRSRKLHAAARARYKRLRHA